MTRQQRRASRHKQRGFIINPFAFGVSSAFDLFPTATAIWSVRRCRAAYSGPALQVRRGGDNAQSDFNFVSGSIGALVDIAAIISWASSGGGDGSAYIEGVYEQHGTGNHLEQQTSANRPRIVNAGVAEVIGTAPAWYFDGAGDSLRSLNSTGLACGTSNFGFDIRLKTGTLATNATIWDMRFNSVSPNSLMDLIYAFGPGALQYNSNAVNFGLSSSLSNNTIYDLETNRVSGNVITYKDGVATATCSSATNLTQRRLKVGNNFNDGAAFQGWVNEVVSYNASAAHTTGFTPSAAPA